MAQISSTEEKRASCAVEGQLTHLESKPAIPAKIVLGLLDGKRYILGRAGNPFVVICC